MIFVLSHGVIIVVDNGRAERRLREQGVILFGTKGIKEIKGDFSRVCYPHSKFARSHLVSRIIIVMHFTYA